MSNDTDVKYAGCIWVITGSRAGGSGVSEVLDSLVDHFGKPDMVYVGDANGVDDRASEWAKETGIDVRVFAAEWDRHGRSAGPIRNRKMLKEAAGFSQSQMCVAFPLEGAKTRSPGTWNCIHQAVELGMGTLITPLVVP